MKAKQSGVIPTKNSKGSLFSILNIPSDVAILLPNHDDLGLGWGSNEAFLELNKYGFINSSSVMVPCPWFPHVVQIAQEHKELNIGIHLTLTSEWKAYRWRPLSTLRKSSGLVDEGGYFWKNRKLLIQNLNIHAAEIELKKQIETALSAGIDLTHIDCHMGIGFIPQLFEIYVNLGKCYQLPVLLFNEIDPILDLYKIDVEDRSIYINILRKLEDDGYPLFNQFKISPCFDSVNTVENYENLILGIPKGSAAFFSLHPNKPGDIEKIDPGMHHIRTDEYHIFGRDLKPDWAASNNIELINFKLIRDFLRKNYSW